MQIFINIVGGIVVIAIAVCCMFYFWGFAVEAFMDQIWRPLRRRHVDECRKAFGYELLTKYHWFSEDGKTMKALEIIAENMYYEQHKSIEVIREEWREATKEA